jgi:hypothetical protein
MRRFSRASLAAALVLACAFIAGVVMAVELAVAAESGSTVATTTIPFSTVFTVTYTVPPPSTVTVTAQPSTTTTESTSTTTSTATTTTTTSPPPPPPPPPSGIGLAKYGTSNGWRLPFRSGPDQDFEIGQDVQLHSSYVRIGPSDTIIQKLLAQGITPIILFGGNPNYPWGTSAASLASTAASYADRWGDRIMYECLNEVNIHGWTPDAYLPYLHAFYDAVKAKAPGALVLMDGLWTTSSSTSSQALIPWSERFINLGGLNYTDLFNVHLYDDPAEHGSWSIWDMTFGSGGAGFYDAKNVRSLIDAWDAAHGKAKMSIVSTESGGPVPKYTEAKQATIVTNALHAADGFGTGYRRTAFTLIYNVEDDDVAGFGLLDSNLNPRPAWNAFKAVATA